MDLDKDCWGYTLSLDLYDCDPGKIKSFVEIKNYVVGLCDVIKMKRHGNSIIKWFGQEEKVAGYSLMQLIETSSIVGHFVESTNNAYIDIFTCKKFDVEEAINFTFNFFKAKEIQSNILNRK